MNKKGIVKELKDTIGEFQSLLSSFDENQLNSVPFKGSWTPGQVAHHIIMANSGFGEVLNGPVEETVRASDQMIDRIKTDFLNFNFKMTSPDFIYPKFKIYDKERLLMSLEKIREDITRAITDLELESTCLAFELPVYGRLTRLEAVYFVVYHTKRHAHQLKKIKQHYSSS
ncbi:DinB family protein [Pedobacter sp. ASV1-7]|uniref:DinB family protein n=1 Tax=Pedobacter sp. ASV1-7 TaxID=3145237 RepID=UPI0032E91D6B